MSERRPVLTDPEVLETLAHPVRLELLTYLMATGPATASECARAVGDTPSNCSYHLRALAAHGLVAGAEGRDRRTRPWEATITGFGVDPAADPASPEGRAASALLSAAVVLEQRRLREFLSHRDRVPKAWRGVAGNSTYTLRIAPDELARIDEALDAVLRPYIAATRRDAPADATLVEVGVSAVPRTEAPWSSPRR